MKDEQENVFLYANQLKLSKQISMKKTTTIIALTSIVIVGISIPGFTNRGGSPSGKSGSPASNSNTCSSCHSGASITNQTINITTDIPAAGFQPNTDYTITVTADANGALGSVIGFEASIENASGMMQGIPSVTNSRTKKTGMYITHTSAGITPTAGVNTWDFNWNSGMAQDQSTVYVAVNFANNNNGTSGDAVGTATLTLDKASGVSIEENALANIEVYPNPASDFIKIKMESSNEQNVQYAIVNMNGQSVQTGDLNGMGQTSEWTLPIHELKSGIYFLHIKGDKTMNVKKFTVL